MYIYLLKCGIILIARARMSLIYISQIVYRRVIRFSFEYFLQFKRKKTLRTTCLYGYFLRTRICRALFTRRISNFWDVNKFAEINRMKYRNNTTDGRRQSSSYFLHKIALSYVSFAALVKLRKMKNTVWKFCQLYIIDKSIIAAFRCARTRNLVWVSKRLKMD